MTAQLTRNRAIRAARVFFSGKDILEVKTPKAVRSPALEPYIDAVALSGKNMAAGIYLATSPEFGMKRILAAELGMESAHGIYEIAPVFRDDPAGKHHAVEFTMLEWYRPRCTLNEILHETLDCLAHIVSPPGLPVKIQGPLAICDIRTLFAERGINLDFAHPDTLAQKYLELHGSLPQHLNVTDLAIVCFNLLFDEFILPWLRTQVNPVAVTGYPEVLGALAYTENGVAERAEIYWHGVELANAYREEWRADIIRRRWQDYNTIRSLRGMPVHPVDEALLSGLTAMEGVCGVAVGLERVLAQVYPTQQFLV